ncbi:MAG: nuclear transport factor 2 family protein [Actinobacteria bacterium]|nr:nuclear transport factor 2 family protein [Actinomycetota bacterium]
MSDNNELNKKVVEQFWADLYRRDLAAVATYFTEDAHYTDVCANEEGATGPARIVARLRLGIEPLAAYIHHPKLAVAEGDTVITEHAEEWHWHTGEQITFPFVSVHQLRDGKITRWHDYWDMQTLMNAAPQWWVEHIMEGY